MSQVNAGDFPIDPQVTSGTALAEILNRFFNATQTQNSGATAPGTTYPGMFWYNTSVNPPVLMVRNAGNTGWTTFTSTLAIKSTDITGLGTMSGVNSPAPVANGGTGSTTAAGALVNLGIGNVLNQRQVVNISPGSNVQMHWNGTINLQIDSTWFGAAWPMIATGGATYIFNSANAAAEKMWFSWSDPGGIPAYLWGGDAPTGMYLVPPGRLSVNYATSSNTSNNSGAVNGISGWNYSNRAKNPAYLWVTDGSASDQYLTQPGHLRVSYADSAGSAGSAGSISGINTANLIRNDPTGMPTLIWNNGLIQYNGRTGGSDVWWPVNLSDARLKRDVAPSTVDALAVVKKLNFKQFRFIDEVDRKDDDGKVIGKMPVDSIPGRLHRIGLVAQDLADVFEPFVSKAGTWLQPDDHVILMTVAKGLQQLLTRLEALEKKGH